ncbi:synaptosomal-associated protein 25-like [Cochliomyia hominivorax]
MAELEELQKQAGKITDESLESTRRMLNMMEESEEAGKRTIEALDFQREQLNRIENNADEINADVTNVQQSLRRLKNCCNICPTPWKKMSKRNESDAEFQKEKRKNSKIIAEQPRISNNNGNNETFLNHPSGYITRITNDDREDEMDSNLSQVNSILGNLRNMAEDMNTELKTHNDQIERITGKIDNNNIRLDEVNVSATKMLNN